MNKFTLEHFCIYCRKNVYVTYRFRGDSGVAIGNCKCGNMFHYVKLD